MFEVGKIIWFLIKNSGLFIQTICKSNKQEVINIDDVKSILKIFVFDLNVRKFN